MSQFVSVPAKWIDLILELCVLLLDVLQLSGQTLLLLVEFLPGSSLRVEVWGIDLCLQNGVRKNTDNMLLTYNQTEKEVSHITSADLGLKHWDGLQVLLLAVELLFHVINGILLGHQGLFCSCKPLLKVDRDLLLHRLRLENIYQSAITANQLLVLLDFWLWRLSGSKNTPRFSSSLLWPDCSLQIAWCRHPSAGLDCVCS